MTNESMPTDNIEQEPSDTFDLEYGMDVVELYTKSRRPCYDSVWLKQESAAMLDRIAKASGLDIEIVREKLNQIWADVVLQGAREYAASLGSQIETYISSAQQ